MKNILTSKSKLPLLRRTQLLPGESLPSLLERLTQLNYYPSLRILKYICYDHPDVMKNQDDLECPLRVETFLRLSNLIHISPEDLYTASNHCFAPFLSPSGQLPTEFPWIGSSSKFMLTYNLAYGCLRSVTAAQYCPYCLNTAAYHRLTWTPVSAAICLEHRCLLVSQCSNCHKPLSIQEIIRKHCRACQNDLSTTEPISMEGNELGFLSQKLIQSWFAGTDVAKLSNEYKLPPYNPTVLYRFLENLSQRLLTRREDWPIFPAPLDGLSKQITPPLQKRKQLQTLTPDVIFHLYKTAFTGVKDWPNGLLQFLDAYSAYSSSYQNRNKHLNLLRNNWFQPSWKNPDFEFAQQILITYLLAHNIQLPVYFVEQFKNMAWFVEQTGLCSVEHIAQTLDISTEDLHQLLLHGSLKSCLWTHSRSQTPIFEREKLLTLKQNWKLGWSIQEASCWLGISEWDVTKLVEQDLLAVVDRTDADEDLWLLSRQSVEKFFEKITGQIKLFEGNENDISCLNEAVRRIDYPGIHHAVLLQCLADGSLPGLKREPEIYSLNRIYIQKNLLRNFPNWFYARHGKVTGNTFAREKGFSTHLIRDWIRAGLIKSEENLGIHTYFMRSRLEQLAAEYVPDLSQSHYL